jgi:hypothetical protein
MKYRNDRKFTLADFVDRFSVEGDCWIWQGSKTRGGYGQFRWRFGWRRQRFYAHRAMYMAVHGSIPAGMWILHTCDVRACVNPAHLYAGTNAQNVADRLQRGRPNVRHRGPKLTESQALQIRASTLPRDEVMKLFNICRDHYYGIKARRKWGRL